MRSRILVIGGVIILVLSGLIIFSWATKGSDVRSGTIAETGTPPAANVPDMQQGPPTGETFEIGTPQGSVTIKNFYKNPLSTDEGIITFIATDTYEGAYDTVNGRFAIWIKAEPADHYIAIAEAGFMKYLGISQLAACTLGVQVFEMKNPQHPLPLSFCGGGVE